MGKLFNKIAEGFIICYLICLAIFIIVYGIYVIILSGGYSIHVNGMAFITIHLFTCFHFLISFLLQNAVVITPDTINATVLQDPTEFIAQLAQINKTLVHGYSSV